MGLIFGIYPGRTSAKYVGPEEDPEQIKKALSQLCKNQGLFLVRGYLHYIDNQNFENEVPENMMQYVTDKIKLDLTLCYRSQKGDMQDWKFFVTKIIRQYGTALAKIQITEEPNNPDSFTGGDGASPNIIEAIIEGILIAKATILELGLSTKVGFNAVVSFNPSDTFWSLIAIKGDHTFIHALDYVGLDFFPDVFRPLPLKPDGTTLTIEEATYAVINHFININLIQANIPVSIPLHITENGWATNAKRSEEKQKEVLEKTLLTILNISEQMRITHYEYFALRDADNSSDDLQFGLLRDDYSMKPSFERFCTLIDANRI
jgi:hypothetical protein